MAEVESLTVAILREIRDEIRSTNSRLDQTNERLGHVEETLLDLAEQPRFLVRHAKTSMERDRKLADEVDDLRERVEALEARDR